LVYNILLFLHFIGMAMLGAAAVVGGRWSGDQRCCCGVLAEHNGYNRRLTYTRP